jgi:hypothetical protein
MKILSLMVVSVINGNIYPSIFVQRKVRHEDAP